MEKKNPLGLMFTCPITIRSCFNYKCTLNSYEELSFIAIFMHFTADIEIPAAKYYCVALHTD